MDNLEGGLAYLQDVVINDALGINSELEAQMDAVVDAYQCEWKTTVESPEKLKRFSHFINAAEEDNNLLYVRERGQRRPATDSERIELVELTTEKH